MSEDKKKYDLSKDKKQKKYNKEDITSVEHLVDKIIDFKKLDEANPLEKAKKYEIIKNNLPEKDFMKVDVFERINNDGSPGIVSKSENGELEEDPFFTIDLNTLFSSSINACPSNVVPMLIEQAKQDVREEKLIFKKDKRDKEFPWGWVIIGLSFIPGIVLLIYYLT